MKVRTRAIWGAVSVVVLAVLFLTPGCTGGKATYSPQEHMVTIWRYNNFLAFGPCGMPWNYDETVVILLREGLTTCPADQVEVYEQVYRVNAESGVVHVDEKRQTVTVDLELWGEDEYSGKPQPFSFHLNGTYSYVERSPGTGGMTREYVKGWYSGEESMPYLPW